MLNHLGREFFTAVPIAVWRAPRRSQAASAACPALPRLPRVQPVATFLPSLLLPSPSSIVCIEVKHSEASAEPPGLQILPLPPTIYNFSSFKLLPHHPLSASKHKPKHTLFTHFLCATHSLLLTIISSILHSPCLPLQPLHLLHLPRFPALTAVPPLSHPLPALMVTALPAMLVTLLKLPVARMMVRILSSFSWFQHFERYCYWHLEPGIPSYPTSHHSLYFKSSSKRH
jgi:hypothetical protein